MADDGWGRQVLISKGIGILSGYGEAITVRQLYYRLVSVGMPNTQQHYKRVVAAMTQARWDGDVDMESFIDRERDVFGETKAEETDLDDKIGTGKEQIGLWMRAYHLNRWENQPNYVEVWIEKKALQGVFERPCYQNDVALCPCKGYPSLTYLNEAQERFAEAESRGQEISILYFGDYNPSGVDIPRSLGDNLDRMGVFPEVRVVALHPDQISEMGLPGAPVKRTDSRSAGWSGGVVELDAVEPTVLRQMAVDAIGEMFDGDLHQELQDREEDERRKYQEALHEHVKELAEGDDDDEEDE